MNWYWADPHFGHDSIIDYCKRPYKNSKKMEIDLIRKYRTVVDPEKDTVYILGDLTLAGPQNKGYVMHILSQLPGRKIFIMGNHDKLDPFTYVELGIESVHTSLDIGKYILVHDPAPATGLADRKWLCGHVHTIFKKIRNIVNVGVDQHGFFPVSEEEVDKIFADERERI